MEQQYGDDFISITDEDGKEYELEVLAELEHNGSRYLALVPAGSGNDDEEEDLEVSILKSVEENGEEFLEAIEDAAKRQPTCPFRAGYNWIRTASAGIPVFIGSNSEE